MNMNINVKTLLVLVKINESKKKRQNFPIFCNKPKRITGNLKKGARPSKSKRK